MATAPTLQDQAAEAMLRFFRRVEGEARQVENALLYGEISQRAGELAALSDGLRVSAHEAPAELLLDTATAVRERAEAVRQVAEGFRGPFLLFVIGMGKHGKSTLINALIGSEVAPVGVQPRTWKIDVFSASQPAGQVRILFRDGRDQSLSTEETSRLLADEEQRRYASEDEIYREFRRQSKSLKNPDEKEELMELLTSRLLYRSPIAEVRWPCHTSPVLQHFDIVDTPGLVQELGQETFRDYYHKAHGVLWMLDATVISAKQSRQLIDDLDQTLERVGGRVPNTVAVLNKIDLVDSAAPRVLEEALRIYDGRFLEIVPFSAKMAFAAAQRGDAALQERSGLTELTQVMERYFLLHGRTMRRQSQITGFRQYIGDLVTDSQPFAARLHEAERERQQRERDLNNALSGMSTRLNEQVTRSLTAYQEDVGSRIARYTVGLFDIESDMQRQHFIEQEIMNRSEIERIQGFLAREVATSAQSLLQEHYQRSLFHRYPRLREIHLPARLREGVAVAPDIATHRFKATYRHDGPVNDLSSAVRWLSSMVSQTSIGRWLIIQVRLPGIRSEFNSKLGQIVNSLREQYQGEIRRLVDDTRRQVTQARETTFAALYGPSAQVGHVLQELARIPEIGTRALPRPQAAELIAGRYSDVKKMDAERSRADGAIATSGTRGRANTGKPAQR